MDIPSFNIPPPAGMRECAAGEKFQENLENTLQVFGSLAACFRSDEKIVLAYESTGLGIFSEKKNIKVSKAYAYAIYIKTNDSYIFSKDDFERLRNTTKKQWASYKPIGGLQSEKHRKYVESLINNNMSHKSEANLSLYAPFLVKFDDSIEDQYVVTSIRRRIIKIGVNKFNSTKIQSTGLMYKNDSILRLDYSRDLQNANDVDHVLSEAKSWMTIVKVKNEN